VLAVYGLMFLAIALGLRLPEADSMLSLVRRRAGLQ